LSSALGISAVTAVLQYLFHQIYSSSGLGTVSITAVAPDVAQASLSTDSNTQLQVNLFLHQVTLNAAWRNMGLPTLAADGITRLNNPPLALDLHYLLTAYSSYDTGAEALLGYGVQFLHENPVLTRIQIAAAFLPANLPPSSKNPLAGSLGSSGLAEQIEMIKITPATLGREEMAWLWTALKADYRPTFPFQTSVVLIQSQNPLLSALPVLRRRVSAQGNTAGPFPTLTEVIPPGGQPAACLGDTVTVQGTNLTGAANIVLTNSRLGIQQTIAGPTVTSDSSLQFTVPDPPPPVPPAGPTDLPAGVYLLSAQVPNGSDAVATNSLPLAIAPSITAQPASPITLDAQGNATVTISCAPFLRLGQEVSLLIGGWSTPANPFTTPTNTPSFTFSSLQAASPPLPPLPVRLRVDGIDSPIVDMTKTPPVFSGPTVQIA
jgi:Pvc16 N-terminal domain